VQVFRLGLVFVLEDEFEASVGQERKEKERKRERESFIDV
jgi:hypothetical protein